MIDEKVYNKILSISTTSVLIGHGAIVLLSEPILGQLMIIAGTINQIVSDHFALTKTDAELGAKRALEAKEKPSQEDLARP